MHKSANTKNRARKLLSAWRTQRRAFRRQTTPSEVDKVLDVWETLSGTPDEGIVVATLLLFAVCATDTITHAIGGTMPLGVYVCAVVVYLTIPCIARGVQNAWLVYLSALLLLTSLTADAFPATFVAVPWVRPVSSVAILLTQLMAPSTTPPDASVRWYVVLASFVLCIGGVVVAATRRPRIRTCGIALVSALNELTHGVPSS